MRLVLLLGLVLGATSGAALAASVSKTVDVNAPADKVWGMIGAFCSIKDWHPAIGECAEKSGVRTLTTKDGKATFVEKQTNSDDKKFTYSYEIEKSPLPVSDYKSTIKVTPKGDKDSTIGWTSTYTPEKGKEQAAESAITGMYQAGLDNIQKMAGK